MIAAAPRFAALRVASLRNSTRLWAAWNRFCGSGMPKGIKRIAPPRHASLRIASLRFASRRHAAHRPATQRNATQL
jgi:hypothetical protein